MGAIAKNHLRARKPQACSQIENIRNPIETIHQVLPVGVFANQIIG